MPHDWRTFSPTRRTCPSSVLDCVADEAVWNYARANDFVIVTKDPDFADLSVVYGPPPKVVWLRLGNCTTREIEAAIRQHRREIEALANDATVGVLEVSEATPPASEEEE